MCLQALALTAFRHYSSTRRQTASREECQDTQDVARFDVNLLILRLLKLLDCACSTIGNLGAARRLLEYRVSE